ncbi:MAG: hypothetical protein Q8O42_15235 [Acidobacteriota bacterium]|nr:hypothetical protein [Acidobacteriota bacterium]
MRPCLRTPWPCSTGLIKRYGDVTAANGRPLTALIPEMAALAAWASAALALTLRLFRWH